METLKEHVEKTIRKFYGFGSNINVKDVDVQFGVATRTNGTLPMAVLPPPTEKRPYKRRKPRMLQASKSLHREYTTSPEDVACIRYFFSIWRKEGLLTPDMENFISQTQGVRYPLLSQETKQRMREIFEEIREKVLFTKKQGRENNE